MSLITPIKTLNLKSPLRFPPLTYRSNRIPLSPPNTFFNAPLSSPIRIINPIYQDGRSRILWRSYASDNFSEMGLDSGADSNEMFNEKNSIMETLKKANSILPHVVLASTVLALIYPPSFTWFTSRFLPWKLKTWS